MSKSKITKIPVIVPLLSFIVYDIGSNSENKLSCTHEIKLPGLTEDGIHLVRFSQRIPFSQYGNFFDVNKNIVFPTPLGQIKFDEETSFPESTTSFDFNCAFVLNYYNKQKGGICIFPHQIESLTIEPSIILKLFAPGNVFLPLAIINKFGKQKINHNNICFKNENHMSFATCDLEKFKDFYIDYWEKLTKVKEKMQNEDKNIVSWAKRINNGLYFLNQTYFAKTANSLPQDARIGNEMRLIYLITALDALIGCDSSGKKLAKNCYNAIGSLFPKIEKRIINFYELRSNYIHANDEKMINYIKDREIEELHRYVQKLILFNLRLLNCEDFVNSFQKSGKKHYFQHLENINNQPYFTEIIKCLNESKDLY